MGKQEYPTPPLGYRPHGADNPLEGKIKKLTKRKECNGLCPKCCEKRIQPFNTIHGMESSKYEFWVVSKSDKKEIQDKKRRKVVLEVFPGDIIDYVCDCEGFTITYKGEKPCECVKNSAQCLIDWEEIQTIRFRNKIMEGEI